jgi:hypothetical protein
MTCTSAKISGKLVIYTFNNDQPAISKRKICIIVHNSILHILQSSILSKYFKNIKNQSMSMSLSLNKKFSANKS